MSSPAGWYPDPSGMPGKYRYWDGQQWSATVQDAPGPSGPGGAAQGPQAAGTGPQAPYDPGAASQAPYADYSGAYVPPPIEADTGKRQWAWWLGAAIVLVALVLIVGLALRAGTGLLGNRSDPGGQPTTSVCPPNTTVTPTPVSQPQDGRVHGGKLSYPKLGEPFSDVLPEYNVPFARDTHQQVVLVEPEFDGASDWITTVMVGRLVAGDGFFTPQQGSRIITDCVIGEFYGNAEVTRNDRVNQATTIDGHEAWIVESDLSFRIEGLETDGELLIVAVVDTGDSGTGLFYASIPNTVPELEAPAREALAGLAVDD